MNPLMFFRSAPYIVIVILIAALSWMSHLYLDKRDQLAALTASVQALSKAAEDAIEEKKKEGLENLQTVKEEHEKLIPTIRSNAVAAYRMRHPDARSSKVSGDAASKPVDVGTVCEPVPDRELLENCAEDAARQAAWRDWCKLNKCKVK
jgi:hypothetical protein